MTSPRRTSPRYRCLIVLCLWPILTQAATFRYVWQGSPNPAPPHDTWVNAAHTIQEAVEAAEPEDTVLVAGGIYDTGGRAIADVTNRVTIDKPITVESLMGPEVTWIVGAAGFGGGNGTGAVRGVYVGEGAVLSGFTVTNGHTGIISAPSAASCGGGVHSDPSGVITNCLLTGNSAVWGGGVYGGVLYDCDLTGNVAEHYGGGAYDAVLSNCVLTGNATVLYYGGGAYRGTLDHCIVTGNSAERGGGVQDAMLTRCQLTGNWAFQGGEGHNSFLLDCTVEGNWAEYYGGGVSDSTLSNCTLTANATLQGGGGASWGTLYNCTVTGNEADWGGGAFYATLRGCVLTDNVADSAGGGSYGGTFYNCTLTGNAAGGQGGGILYGTLYNCLVYHNNARTDANHAWAQWYYSCTTPLPTNGIGNIDDDPRLASDSHLSSGSPCIEAGLDDYAAGLDIDGEPWLSPPCIGADQVVPGGAVSPLSVAIEAEYTSVVPGFQIAFRARIEGQTTGSQWDFGDGPLLTNQPFGTTYAWDSIGIYPVTLTAFNDAYPAGISATVTVYVVTTPVCYVNQANPDPVFPYTSWETAATNIQDAIGASPVGGRLVWVTNGVYDLGGAAMTGSLLTNRVALTNAVTVRSVNGPLLTTIRGAPAPGDANGDGAVRCAYVDNRSVLDGFTLTNGHTRVVGHTGRERSGAGVFGRGSGVLTNCILTGNWAARDGGGADSVILYNCTLTGNRASDDSGGADECTLFDCTLTDNVANENGGGADESTLYRCTLSGNSAGSGGGVDDSTLFFCTVTDNTARYYGGGADDSILHNSVLSGNVAGMEGGGTENSTLYGCVLTGNRSEYRGGGAEDSDLFNCTVTDNVANERSGGVDGCRLYNCIVYFNHSHAFANYHEGSWNYSCTTPLPPGGEGNIAEDPRLASASHLSAESPCLGAGSDFYARGTDIDGEPWLSPPCMGADQIVSGEAVSPLSVAIEADFTTVVPGFLVSFRAHIGGQTTGSQWDLGDGTPLHNQPFGVSYAWDTVGVYPVRLTAFNDAYPAGISATTLVQVVEQPVSYADRASANPVFPYATWETAATNIQDAIGASQVAGRWVWVANGVYDLGGVRMAGSLLTNRIALTNAVTVQSVQGPSVTFLQGTSPAGNTNYDMVVRGAYVGRRSILSGFTVTNGNTQVAGVAGPDQSGGGVWCEETGLVKDCLLTGSTALRGGAAYGGSLLDCVLIRNSASYGAGAIYSSLSNCLVRGNLASLSGGGAQACTVSYSLVTNNVAYRGAGAYDSLLYDCTLTGNAASDNGGGAYDCTLVRSSLTLNVGQRGGGAFSSTLYSCILTNNRANHDGGGTDQSTLYNCVLLGNRAADDGGGTDESTLYNCTLVSNSATDIGGGASESRLYNCIAYYNYANAGVNYAHNTILHYSCATPRPGSGSGNIGDEPAFVNLTEGDLRLRPDSPCIDAGMDPNQTAYMDDPPITNDFGGTPRPLDGDGDGTARFDMGAYEFDLRTVVPPEWFLSYGLDPSDPQVVAGDPDHDTCTTYQEWVADTDPTNALSRFRIVSIVDLPPVTVFFPSSSNRVYSLVYATNLTTPGWLDVLGQVDVPGTGHLHRLSDPSPATKRFYRVRVAAPR